MTMCLLVGTGSLGMMQPCLTQTLPESECFFSLLLYSGRVKLQVASPMQAKYNKRIMMKYTQHRYIYMTGHDGRSV